jgi:hypothetical protein
MGSTTKREQDQHAAGGPGKSSRKGHVDPEHSGNKPGQLQTPTSRGPGEGGTRGAEDEKRDGPS